MTTDSSIAHEHPDIPPDRSHIHTEARHPKSMDLHTCSIAECVQRIVAEDQSVALAVEEAGPSVTAFLEQVHPRFNEQGGRLIYIGAGTSGRLGVLDASEAPPTFQIEPGRIVGIIAGGDTSLRVSSEGKEDDRNGARKALDELGLTNADSVLGIAAGGTTPYVQGALEYAKTTQGSLTGLLACTAIDPMPTYIDCPILIKTGPELLTGSTRMKAGTATKMVLNIISTTLMIQAGRVYENLMVDMRASNDKLQDRAARIIVMLNPDLDRQGAFDLLNRADGQVKVALIMQHCSLATPDEAIQLLKQHAGRLDQVLR